MGLPLSKVIESINLFLAGICVKGKIALIVTISSEGACKWWGGELCYVLNYQIIEGASNESGKIDDWSWKKSILAV